jgi:4-amino-4-deoxy-L-arabinose transferase-like glycosyltransferase
MSADEGPSWAAASAPTVAEVIARQSGLNRGKLPIHDLMLHGWITLFGSSLPAMRAMSALLGVFSILLVYLGTRELFAIEPATGSPLSNDDIRILAALAALIFAVNLVTIKYSREARMYPLMLAAIFAQVAMFLRTLRFGGIGNYLAVAILTALAIGTNFSALLIPATEGVWLWYVLARALRRPDDTAAKRAWALAIALAGGGLILAPKLLSSLHRASAPNAAAAIIGWAKPPPLYAPIAMFNKAAGTFAFPVLAALAAWGAIRGWRRGARDAISFALLWMWLPPLLMVVASYAIAPVFVERYALSCFVPFFILTAVGIYELPGDAMRLGALVLAVAISLGHIVSYDRKPHDTQYREAVAAADAAHRPGEAITVIPQYAIDVLRYYLPADHRDRAVVYDPSISNAAVLIVADQNLAPPAVESYRKEYPQTVARFRGATVVRK